MWIRTAMIVYVCGAGVGCGGGGDATGGPAAPAASKPAEADATTCAEAPGWRYERIVLPPEFAPSMPSGVEILWFAPGMFKPESDEYFSYVFSLELEQPMEMTTDAVTDLLHDYYRGLIGAVAEGKKLPVDEAGIVASVQPTAAGYRAQVALPDAFTTGDVIAVHMELSTSPQCVRAAASAHSPDADVWPALRRALDCLPCP